MIEKWIRWAAVASLVMGCMASCSKDDEPEEEKLGGFVAPAPSASQYGALKFLPYNLGADPLLSPKEQMSVNSQEFASRVCGGLYQWGRKSDGHEDRNSQTCFEQPPNAGNVGHGMFIVTSDFESRDWASPSNPALWGSNYSLESQPVSIAAVAKGDNDPCPAGYRIPTQYEWSLIGPTEITANPSDASEDTFNTDLGTTAPPAHPELLWVRISEGTLDDSGNNWASDGKNRGYALYKKSEWQRVFTPGNLPYHGALLTSDSAPEPLLYLPASGYRTSSDRLSYLGSVGFYWSSTVIQDWSYFFYFGRDNVSANLDSYRGYGMTVRCIQM